MTKAIEYQQERPNCRVCNRPVRSNTRLSAKGFIRWRTLCNTCSIRPYRQYIKSSCEFCNFIPIHLCQLDIDHKDGNKENNNPINLQTLCANCHRLKTHVNRDYVNKI